MTNLADKVVFITGAARGIGAGTARALVGEGARVILVDVDTEPLKLLADELGERAVAAVADVRDLDAMTAAAATGTERFGGIDLVLANAGIGSYGSVLTVDPDAFKRVIDVNLLGVFHTVRATGPSVLERHGYILIVSSMAAFGAAAGMASYNASKAGVEHFANALRLELGEHGVDVGSAHMSWIDTPLVRDVESDLSGFSEMLKKLPGPLGRISPLEDCVDAFVAGLDQRKRRVYVPRSIGLVGWARMLLTTGIVERAMISRSIGQLRQMDDEVAALGRSLSARIDKLTGR
ncbi:SDR family oxidoreductase [Aldersonia sp. NBC_00410]|uniref:SDR family oxidoreductase n=1 Tax=Aldersonia sp. NBC_00410 TaxID=2975954 RepID=UPI00224E9541|nr:SDR family oxidoreductase [Aldersonia sp. NBC_00410]MCX5041953.1 SDR family oxidoreductase [Aldersonia sp. NBC_00410]